MIVLMGARVRATEARAEVISESKEKRGKEVKASKEEGGREAPRMDGMGEGLGLTSVERRECSRTLERFPRF